MASANFTINGNACPPEVAVAFGSTVTLALVSVTGVRTVQWSIVGKSHESAPIPTITPSGSPSGVTATFTMPTLTVGVGVGYVVQCIINNGKDDAGQTDGALKKTALVGVVDAAGSVPFTYGEQFERSSDLAYAQRLNDVAQASATGGAASTIVLNPAKAAATSNVASLSGTTTLDGISCGVGDRAFLAFQTTASQNGPWLIQSGAWTRPGDFDAFSDLLSGQTITVTQGATYGGTSWMLVSSGPFTLGTTDLTWAQVGGSGGSAAGTIQPVDIVLTSDDSLSGLAARDGFTPVAGSRALATAQSTDSQNGVYVCASGAWTRAADCDADGDLRIGQQIRVKSGTIGAGQIWELSSGATIAGAKVYQRLPDNADRTYIATRNGAWLNVTEPFTIASTTYQVKTTSTGTQNRVALQAALDYLGSLGGGTIWIGAGSFDIDDTLVRPQYVNIIGAGQFCTTLRITVAKDLIRQWQPLNVGAVGGHHTQGIKFLCSALTGIRAWAASTAYSLNEYVRVDVPHPCLLKCTTAGTTGSFRPHGELSPFARADNTMRLRGQPSDAKAVRVKCVLGGLIGTARFQISVNGGTTYGTATNGFNAAYNASDATTYYQPAYNAVSATIQIESGFSVEIAQGLYGTALGPTSNGVYIPYPRMKVSGAPNATRRFDASIAVAGPLGTAQVNFLYNSPIHAPGGSASGALTTVSGASHTFTNVGGTGQDITVYGGEFPFVEPASEHGYHGSRNQFSLVDGDVIQDGTCTWTVVRGPAAIDDVGCSQWSISQCSFWDFSIGVALCQSEGVTIADCDWRRGNWFACAWAQNSDERYFGASGGFTNNVTLTGHNIMFAQGLGVCDDGGFGFTLRDGNMQGANYGHWIACRNTLTWRSYYLEGAALQFGYSTYNNRSYVKPCTGVAISDNVMIVNGASCVDFFYAGGIKGLTAHGNTFFCQNQAFGNADQIANADIAGNHCYAIGLNTENPIVDKMPVTASRAVTMSVSHQAGVVARTPAALALGATAGVNRAVAVSASRHYVTNATGPWTLGSIVPPGASWSDGQEVEIIDTTGNIVTVTHEDTGEATAARRIVCPGGIDAVVASGRLRLTYIKAQSRWYLLSSGQQPGVTLEWYNKNAPGDAANPYITLDGIQASTAAGPGQRRVGRPFVANYFAFDGVTALSGASVVCTVQKNGVDTALTFTIADGSVTPTPDTTHAVQFARGDLVGVKAVQSATATQADWHGKFTLSGPAL